MLSSSPTDSPAPPADALAAVGATLASAPGGGGVGEVTGGVIAIAAGLCEAVARASLAGWEDARGVVAQAAELRRRAHLLAGDNARAYAAVRQALRPPDPGDRLVTGRDGTLHATLLDAALVPLQLATTAADCALLAVAIARDAHPDLRADAVGAAELAAGAARSAAWLVEINLALLPDDPFRLEARAVVAEAQAAVAAVRGGE